MLLFFESIGQQSLQKLLKKVSIKPLVLPKRFIIEIFGQCFWWFGLSLKNNWA
jgi:hypothetical protein